MLCTIYVINLTSKNVSFNTQTYENTGHFIMYSGITKIYYMKTVGHVFTKPVQIEETTEQFFFSQYIVFHRSSHLCC
jgi:hypothetical protein